MTIKTKKIIVVAALIVNFSLFFATVSSAQKYTPLEKIPGTVITEQDTFPEYVKAIYKFAIWTVGIAALFMISVGGFMYFTAAGNNSRMETAKNIITDALWGLVAVLAAWVFLNVINPDLVNINLDSISNLK